MVEKEIRFLSLLIEQFQGNQGAEAVVDDIPYRMKGLLVKVFPEK